MNWVTCPIHFSFTESSVLLDGEFKQTVSVMSPRTRRGHLHWTKKNKKHPVSRTL